MYLLFQKANNNGAGNNNGMGSRNFRNEVLRYAVSRFSNAATSSGWTKPSY